MQHSMIRKPISVLLSLLMVLSVFSVTAFAGSPSDNTGGELHTDTDVNVGTPGIMSETIDTTQGPWEESYDFDGNDVRIFAMEGGGYGDGHGFHLYGDTFYANIKARNAQRPITITGAEVTSGENPISWLRPLKGTMTVDGDTAIISDVYSSTLRLESESNLRIKEVKVYYYYAVSGVTLNETYAAMNIGDTKTLTATVAPDDAMYKNVTWASANPDIATVSDTGVVTAVAPGRVNITATADNGTADTSDDKTATCSVRVLGEVETTLSYLVWDDASKTLVEKTGDEACANYELITADTTALEDGKWYAIDDDTTVSDRIDVNGTAHLILRDDMILTVPKGITTTGATLNIYGQRAGTGELYAGRQQDGYTPVPRSTACIGGVGNADGGTVIIHGGTVTATGGAQAAGIGGGYRAAGSKVTIYGGTVTANGGTDGAGIGGGAQGTGGEVTIYGGTVTATGGRHGAGIGGGAMGGEVTIYGGTVTATGGGDAAGIGGGYRGAGGKVVIYGGTVVANGAQDGSTGGAGIGGGTRGAGGEVIMNGGDVTANGAFGAGIGGGTYGAGGTVTITGGTVKAYSKGTTSSFGAAIGAGSGNSEQGTLTLAETTKVKAESVTLADKEWEDLQEVSVEAYMSDHTQRRAYLVVPAVAVTGVTLDNATTNLTVGKTATLTATVAPTDATNKTVAWSSSNPAVATVDETGTVTAIGAGTATITVTTADGSFTATCDVTVSKADPTVTVPTDLTALCGSRLESIALPEGWTWNDPTKTVGVVGPGTATKNNTFAATFTPDDTTKYNTVSANLTVIVSHDLENHDGQPATCVEEGWNAYQNCKCEGCGYTTYEAIDATGAHVWEWVIDRNADCGNNGVKHQECKNCHAVQAEGTVIEATGQHTAGEPEINTKPATCGEDGYTITTTKCAVCGEVLESTTLVMLATGKHTTKIVNAKEATATEDGYTGDEVCTVCGQTIKTGEVIPKKGEQTPDEPTPDTPDEPTDEPSKDTFRCGFCDRYEAWKDFPAFGWIVSLVHFFVHTAARIGDFT